MTDLPPVAFDVPARRPGLPGGHEARAQDRAARQAVVCAEERLLASTLATTTADPPSFVITVLAMHAAIGLASTRNQAVDKGLERFHLAETARVAA